MGWFTRAFGGDARGPRDVDSALRSALLAVLGSDLDRAEELLAQAVRLDADGVEPYVALARLYRQRGETGRAIRVDQNLLLRNDLTTEQRHTVLLDLGEDYLQGGHTQQAIASFEEVLGRSKSHRRAIEALLGLRAAEGDHDRAADLARRLAQIDGRDAGVAEAPWRVAQSRAALDEGNASEARRLVKRAIRRDKTCVEAWILFGELERARGRDKAAIAAWLRVPELDLASGRHVYGPLEEIYAAQGRAREYETYLREVRRQNPDDPDVRRALAGSLSRRGDDAEARAELRRLIESNPDDLGAQAMLGRGLLADGAREDAIRAYSGLLDSLGHLGLLGGPEKPE